MTIRDYLENSMLKYPERPAQRFYCDGEWKVRTFSKLHELVIRVAAGIRVLGIQPGCDNVALMMENRPEWEEIYLALASVGITVVPIDPKLREREARHILSDSEAVAIFADGKLGPMILKMTNSLPALKACVFTDDFTVPEIVSNGCFIGKYKDFAENSIVDARVREWFKITRPKDSGVASILYTSGTTGAPKGAMLTHANFEANADFAKKIVPFYKTDDFLVVLPLFHAFSFTFSFLVPLYVGGCSSFIRSIKTISEDIRDIRPTTILAVPLLAEKMLAKINAKLKGNIIAKLFMKVGLSCIIAKKVRSALGGRVRIMAIGGAPTDRNVLKAFTKYGIPAVEGYGLTECGPLVCFSPTGIYKVGTVGRILPCMTYKICYKDETGAGELRVKGPNVMKGYYKNPEATAKAFDEEGFLHTGDIVREDSDGNFTICGRYRALIVNREGKNIYPEEIEQVVAGCPLITESVAVGYKVKGETGERIGLIVVADVAACEAAGVDPQNMERAVRKAVADMCTTSLAEYKIPRKIVVRETPLEHTSTMKVRRVIYRNSLDE